MQHHASTMLYILRRRLCSSVRWFIRRRRARQKLVIRPRLNRKSHHKKENDFSTGSGSFRHSRRPVRLATFNAALFSLAPAVPESENDVVLVDEEGGSVKVPKGILKQSPLHPGGAICKSPPAQRSKPKVWINLPDNEISLAQTRILPDPKSFMRSPICFPGGMASWFDGVNPIGKIRTVYDVLREVDADVVALQDVKAEEGNQMRPLSDLAAALGMNYVFAESWAPEYGNAVLSKWPIRNWSVQKICDDTDVRNVIKATVEVPWTGELTVYSTQLDHLNEKWRIKQIGAMLRSDHRPHILAGGLNSLDASDYSTERWNHIVKYYEELGKPTPRSEVTKVLKERGYVDAKGFPGECEPVVMIAKGQNVQGTCKYGTRVDYILGSAGLPYMFVPGSYSVVSSKGTSDHHIVKADIFKIEDGTAEKSNKYKNLRQRVARMTRSCSYRGT